MSARSLQDFVRITKEEREAQANDDEHRVTLKKPVFFGSAIALSIFTAWTLIMPDTAGTIIGTVVEYVGRWFGSYYILLATVILVFVLVIAFSKYGDMRLGPDDSRPQFSTFSWAAMLFAAGIGTDVMFFAVAEPINQYMQPPNMPGETVEAARQGVVWTLFHYGLTGWGMYALMGMALAYFAYRRKLPLAVRSALYPLIGKRIKGPIGHTVDSAAIIGTIFGVAVTLGIGVVQLNYGLKVLLGVPEHISVQAALVLVAIGMSTISATTGVDKGIRFLSQLNVVLAMILVGWVTVTGKTIFLLNALVMNVGDLLSRFPSMTLDTMAYINPEEWMNSWTLFFWAWWVAWASFVGMFLARISRGRKIRQFVFGCLTFPFIYVLMWISIFGNSAIDAVRSGNMKLAEVTMEVPEHGFYMLLLEYPGAMFLVGLATVVGLLFYVTSADSGALVMANLCSNLPKPTDDARQWTRIFWAVITGALTLGVLIAGGIPALQMATIVMGLPFSFVLIAVMAGLGRSMNAEKRTHATHRRSVVNLSGGVDAVSPVNWRTRIGRAMEWVPLKQARRDLDKAVLPAMEQVCDELEKNGLDAQIMYGDQAIDFLRLDTDAPGVTVHDRLFLIVKDTHESFYYQVALVEVSGVAYMGFVGRAGDKTARLEVTTTGSDYNYDIVGYTVDQVIHDIVFQFERYVEFRILTDEAPEDIPVDDMTTSLE